ncbi:MAG: endolytic transglycosylase MltG [Patescibacteria group bacterium]|nr:endolytic transglycosylase MltG [Patescibacteria group bacterium]
MINFLARHRSKRKSLKFLFLVLLLIIMLGFVYYSYALTWHSSNSDESEAFIVEPGWGSTRISFELKNRDFILDPYAFQLYTWINGISSRLQDGEYQLAKKLTLPEISKILNKGTGTSKEIKLTFIEGWSNKDYANYLVQKGVIASTAEFFAAVQKKAAWWDDYAILSSRPKTLDLEGYLFPDTYRIFNDSTVIDVVKKMLANLQNKITPDLMVEIARQHQDLHEILTVASILEKEVSTDQDRKLVADIIYKRLDAGMPLQVDSTVNYVTGQSKSRSSAIDLKFDSPYNTYLYKGLPPGPIDNPGLSSITAAIYPQSNPYYFFLTTPDGEVIYSKTHDEHVAAKAKYYK